MVNHSELTSKALAKLIKSKNIQFAGNVKLKIYGTLHCKSSKRMKPENRVFFSLEQDAINEGYRPCGHCRRNDYLKWKHGII